MNNKIRLALALLVAPLVTNIAPASACGRCGSFGGSCRYVAPVVKQQLVEPAVSTVFSQTYVFNNTTPAQIGGSAVYGFGDGLPSVASYDSPNSAGSADLLLELSRTGDFRESLIDQIGQQLGRESGERSTTLAAQAILEVREGGRENIRSQFANELSTQIVRQTILSDGTVRTERITEGAFDNRQQNGQPNQGRENAENNAHSGNALSVRCGGCHGQDLASPEGSLYLYPGAGIPSESIVEAIRRMYLPADDPQRMPKGENASLSDSERSEIVDILSRNKAPSNDP